MEAAEGGVEFIVAITEGVPAHDEAWFFNKLKRDFPDVQLLGPNCPGIISPGKCNIGITAGHIAKAPVEGEPTVGIVSRSGTLTYQALYELKLNDIGVTTCVGIGGDPVPGHELHRLPRALRGRPRDQGRDDDRRDRRLGRGGGGRLHRRQDDQAGRRLHRRRHRAARQEDGPRRRHRLGRQGHRRRPRWTRCATPACEVGPEPDRGRPAHGRGRQPSSDAPRSLRASLARSSWRRRARCGRRARDDRDAPHRRPRRRSAAATTTTTTRPPRPRRRSSWPALPDDGVARAVVTPTGIVLAGRWRRRRGRLHRCRRRAARPHGHGHADHRRPRRARPGPRRRGARRRRARPASREGREPRRRQRRAAASSKPRARPVVLTRTADYRITLRTRAAIATALAPAAVRVDPPQRRARRPVATGPGAETYYQIASGDSKRLAGLSWEEVVARVLAVRRSPGWPTPTPGPSTGRPPTAATTTASCAARAGVPAVAVGGGVHLQPARGGSCSPTPRVPGRPRPRPSPAPPCASSPRTTPAPGSSSPTPGPSPPAPAAARRLHRPPAGPVTESQSHAGAQARPGTPRTYDSGHVAAEGLRAAGRAAGSGHGQLVGFPALLRPQVPRRPRSRSRTARAARRRLRPCPRCRG